MNQIYKKIVVGLIFFTLATSLSSCGGLGSKTILLSINDNKERVLEVMGTPDDRQLQGENEAWQYCKTGAGFGYNDHTIIWIYQGKITGLSAYKSYGGYCVANIRQVTWQNAPDSTIEVRNR